MVMGIATIICIIGLVLNLISSVLFYKEFSKNHRDIDFINSLKHFVIGLFLIMCIVLNVQSYFNKKVDAPAQQNEILQIEI